MKIKIQSNLLVIVSLISLITAQPAGYDYNIRLSGYYGVVEYRYNGEWLPICNQGLHGSTLQLICKSLGMDPGSTIPTSSAKSCQGTYYYEIHGLSTMVGNYGIDFNGDSTNNNREINCSGFDNLTDCLSSQSNEIHWRSSDCSNNQCAQVICSSYQGGGYVSGDQMDTDEALYGLPTGSPKPGTFSQTPSMQLYFFTEKYWDPICDQEFTSQSANLICQHMNKGNSGKFETINCEPSTISGYRDNKYIGMKCNDQDKIIYDCEPKFNPSGCDRNSCIKLICEQVSDEQEREKEKQISANSSNSIGLIIGVVCGVVVFIIFMVCIINVVNKKNPQAQQKLKEQQVEAQNEQRKENKQKSIVPQILSQSYMQTIQSNVNLMNNQYNPAQGIPISYTNVSKQVSSPSQSSFAPAAKFPLSDPGIEQFAKDKYVKENKEIIEEPQINQVFIGQEQPQSQLDPNRNTNPNQGLYTDEQLAMMQPPPIPPSEPQVISMNTNIQPTPQLPIPNMDPSYNIPNMDPSMNLPNTNPNLNLPNMDPTMNIPNMDPSMIKASMNPNMNLPHIDPSTNTLNMNHTMNIPIMDPSMNIPNMDPSMNIPNMDHSMNLPNINPNINFPNTNPPMNIPNMNPNMNPSMNIPNMDPSMNIPNMDPSIYIANIDPSMNIPNMNPSMNIPNMDPCLNIPSNPMEQGQISQK